MSLLSLDNLAHRYGLLPSEVMARATTFDLYVIDLSARYERYRNELAEGKSAPRAKLTQDQMLDMLKRARSEND
jgi:hypothetical protein